MQYKQHDNRFLRHVLSIPFIWGMLVPLVLFHLALEVYHIVCFWLYGIPYVDRKQYIRMDRYKLPYLSLLDRFNCIYCEYANGLITYAQRIAADTEKYWCGIKHEKYPGFVEPAHQKGFMPYGDKNAYAKACKLQKKR